MYYNYKKGFDSMDEKDFIKKEIENSQNGESGLLNYYNKIKEMDDCLLPEDYSFDITTLNKELKKLKNSENFGIIAISLGIAFGVYLLYNQMNSIESFDHVPMIAFIFVGIYFIFMGWGLVSLLKNKLYYGKMELCSYGYGIVKDIIKKKKKSNNGYIYEYYFIVDVNGIIKKAKCFYDRDGNKVSKGSKVVLFSTNRDKKLIYAKRENM